MSKILALLFEIWQKAKVWLGLVSFVFLVGFASGVIISLVNPDLTRQFFSQYGASVEKIVSVSGFQSAWLIFERNVTIIIFAMALSFLGLVPIFVTFVNGLIFGMIFGFQEIYSNFSFLQILVLIIPHGLIEILASLLGLGIATRAGLRWLFVKQKLRTLQKDFVFLAKSSFLVIALLFIASLLEAFVTPALSCLLFRICF